MRLNCVASIYPVCNGETCGLVACFMWVKLNVLVFLYVIFVFLSVIQILYLYLVSVSESVFGMGQTDEFVFIYVFLIQNYWWLVSINDYSVDNNVDDGCIDDDNDDDILQSEGAGPPTLLDPLLLGSIVP